MQQQIVIAIQKPSLSVVMDEKTQRHLPEMKLL